MCGIAGLAGDTHVDGTAIVRGMLDQLKHRGPDEEGVQAHSGTTLGVRRLAIIDVAGGHQPLANEDGSIIAVQNGEIYNFAELRAELVARGHRLRSDGDTEVIPHLYEEYGSGFAHKLRGMFAIAVWDSRARRLVLTRDRLGKKPLMYAHGEGGLLFASEIQALLPNLRSRTVDEDAIAEYLTYGYIPAPRTAFAEIRKLDPASTLVYENGEAKVERYWTPAYEPKLAISFAEAAERLRAILDEAVRIRLVSEVPLGVLLSGGLDSSAVVAFMAAHSERPVKTFSIGFGERDFDELRYARLVAERYSTDHHELVVEPSAADVLPTLVKHFGEPFADSSAIPTYYVAQLARQHVTVALNGDGGDEAFGGYDRYRAVLLASRLDRVPGLAGGLNVGSGVLGALGKNRRLARIQRLLGSLGTDKATRYWRWMAYFGGTRGELLADRRTATARTGPEFFARAADLGRATDPVERAMAADLLTYLPGDLLVKMDIATMANSLEGRSPFLDHVLVDFVASLPRHYKMSVRRSKLLLRAVVRDLLPNEIMTRGKMGFGVPVGQWLRGPLRDLLNDAVLSPSAHSRHYFRAGALETIVAEHLAGHDRTPLLWAVLMLELWLRESLTMDLARR